MFIVYKTFTTRIKTKNLFKKARFGLWFFYNGGFIRWPPVQDVHFLVAPRVVVLYRFDCIFTIASSFESVNVKSPDGPMVDTSDSIETYIIGCLCEENTILKIWTSFFIWLKNY